MLWVAAMRNLTVPPITALVVALTLALAAPASATTFCVPAFTAACPNDGTNVAQANLGTAMTSNASDGIADRIVIGAGTQTTPGPSTTPEPTRSTSSARRAGRTILTSSATGNVFVAT